MFGKVISISNLLAINKIFQYWHDFQSRSKKKHSTIKQSMGKTGGGTMNTESLTIQEEEVLNIMCSTSIDGHPEIEESTVNLLQIPEVR